MKRQDVDKDRRVETEHPEGCALLDSLVHVPGQREWYGQQDSEEADKHPVARAENAIQPRQERLPIQCDSRVVSLWAATGRSHFDVVRCHGVILAAAMRMTAAREGEFTHATPTQPCLEDSPDRQPEQLAMRAEVRRLMQARIDMLPDAFRTVFMLRAIGPRGACRQGEPRRAEGRACPTLQVVFECRQYAHTPVRLVPESLLEPARNSRLPRMCSTPFKAAARGASCEAVVRCACSLCTPGLRAGMGTHTCQPAAHL